MEIFKKDIMLFYEFSDYMYRESDNDAFNRFKKLIDEYVNVITFYNKGLENLSNLEMYDLLYKLYDILFDDNDCLKVLSQKYNKKYNRFVEFGTYMTFPATKHWKEKVLNMKMFHIKLDILQQFLVMLNWKMVIY